ncbi:hypothetical protein ACIGPN_20000 [Streptomyces afghaniensis]|uniref:Pepco domain-containing protein n=1 Tax=Streptomyces afghaniensis TaxID=66865 RepID=UPI0037D6A14F
MTNQGDPVMRVPILVWDVPDSQAPTEPGYQQQKRLFEWGRGHATKVTEVDLAELRDAYLRIYNQVSMLISAHEESQESTNGWAVNEVTVRLGMSAKGGLAFIAEAGIEAAIEIKFACPGRGAGSHQS